MFAIRTLFAGSQLVFRLLYISTVLFFSPLIQADSKENTTTLSLITKTYLNKTPQLSYKIAPTSKGITATPVLKGGSPVFISRDSGINHKIQINGEEHFVTLSTTPEGKNLVVQTQASNGTSAHLLKVYPVRAFSDDKRRSYYVKDESSGATFLATTNANASSLTIQQTGNKTTDDDCVKGYKTKSGKCYAWPEEAIVGTTFGIAIVLIIAIIASIVCCKKCQSGSGGSTFISLGFIGEG